MAEDYDKKHKKKEDEIQLRLGKAKDEQQKKKEEQARKEREEEIAKHSKKRPKIIEIKEEGKEVDFETQKEINNEIDIEELD